MAETNKAYTLIFEDRQHYLYARVEADTITEKIALDYCREVGEECRRLNHTRLLVHRLIPEMLPSGTLYYVATQMAEFVQGIKTAFVNPYRSNQDALDFSVLVGENRGANYGTFNNTDDAEIWLLT